LPDKPLYVHFDTDVVDIVEMPGMGYPAPNGPPLDTCAAALERVSRDSNAVGLLFSLWNDSLPTDGKSLAGVLRLAQAFVEGKASART
jgi:arginase